jgi:hypothetical protein
MEGTDPVENEEAVSRLDSLVDATIDIEDVAFGVRVLILDLFRRRDRKRKDALVLDQLGKAVDPSGRGMTSSIPPKSSTYSEVTVSSKGTSASATGASWTARSITTGSPG